MTLKAGSLLVIAVCELYLKVPERCHSGDIESVDGQKCKNFMFVGVFTVLYLALSVCGWVGVFLHVVSC